MDPILPVDDPLELGTSERIVTLCSPETCTHDPKHRPLPILILGDSTGGVLTRWRFTDEERAQIAAGGDLWIWQELGDRGFPPILPTTERPLIGDSCPDCRHKQPHEREREDGSVGLCWYCSCASAWVPALN